MIEALRITVLLLWPMTAWATSVTLGASLSEVPFLAWVMVLILSLISGLAALLTRWREADPVRPVLFAVSHMLGSLLAGFLVFLIAEHLDRPDFEEAVFIAVAAFAGARLIDAAAMRMISGVEKA